MLQYFFGIGIFLVSIFLVLLVLVQRGRGGGLAGALGGPGGQSAFGTKAGDLFTWITIWVAVAWIVLCSLSVIVLKPRALPTLGGNKNTSSNADAGAGASVSTDNAGSTITRTTGNVPPNSIDAGTGLPEPPIDMELPNGAEPQAEIEGMPELPDAALAPLGDEASTGTTPAATEGTETPTSEGSDSAPEAPETEATEESGETTDDGQGS